ncbi:MAG: 16S rRNA (adenine(1518)-N(6)/adenine(1519)-N(6))-dimethyltransferase RsmA [Rhodothalassiaceae bacterium]
MSDDPLPPLSQVIATHGLSARKSLGQNFLLDLNLTRRIARVAKPAGAVVIEIGPGPGGLTRALLAEGAAQVLAIERDARCAPALAEIAAAWPGRLTVIEGDALAVDLSAHIEPPYVIAANLPYNVGTQLLIGWLTQAWPPPWRSLTLMFQKEVADRLVARPGSKAYGRLSVLAQWRAVPRIAFNLPARAFTPPPKIASSVVHIEPTAPVQPDVPRVALEQVVQAAFAQRRKMLRSALKTLTPEPEPLLKAADLSPDARAETVNIAGFCRLARAWALQDGR